MIRQEFSIKSQAGDILAWERAHSRYFGVVGFDGEVLATWREGKKDIVGYVGKNHSSIDIAKDSYVRLANRVERGWCMQALLDNLDTPLKEAIEHFIGLTVQASELDTVTVKFIPENED